MVSIVAYYFLSPLLSSPLLSPPVLFAPLAFPLPSAPSLSNPVPCSRPLYSRLFSFLSLLSFLLSPHVSSSSPGLFPDRLVASSLQWLCGGRALALAAALLRCAGGLLRGPGVRHCFWQRAVVLWALVAWAFSRRQNKHKSPRSVIMFPFENNMFVSFWK